MVFIHHLLKTGIYNQPSLPNSGGWFTDLDMDSGEWDSYSIGEKVDLDNDGENELIICGPYLRFHLLLFLNLYFQLSALCFPAVLQEIHPHRQLHLLLLRNGCIIP